MATPLMASVINELLFDKEIEKGMTDVKACRVYSADAISNLLEEAIKKYVAEQSEEPRK